MEFFVPVERFFLTIYCIHAHILMYTNILYILIVIDIHYNCIYKYIILYIMQLYIYYIIHYSIMF